MSQQMPKHFPGAVFNQNGYKCISLKPRGKNPRVSVKHVATNVSKTITLKPKLNKAFDWDPIIDGLALAGDAIAPELMPFIHMGKTALKHWLKKGKKEKKVKKEGKKLEEAFKGGKVERRLKPFQDFAVPKKAPFKDIALQDNLRECINGSFKESAMVKSPKIEQYARLNPKSRLSEHSVPVLNGDMGSAMDMHPVTITKTEAHAVIAGSELLGDLIIPSGAGAAGNNPVDFYINPRAFAGTKIAYEAQTWLQFRFRKFVLEYCPTIGSGTTGNFIAFYTQDPNEQMMNGLAQRRNATEHDHAVPFQPFSYMACAMTPKPQDETLYYCDADVGADDRLQYQGRLLITNNAQNQDESTVPTYGTLTIHYECDFYFPAITASVSGLGPRQLTFTGDLSPAATSLVQFSIASGSFADAKAGAIYTAIPTTVPSGGLDCYFETAQGNFKLIAGQTYLLKCKRINGANTDFHLYDTMYYANQDDFDSDGGLVYDVVKPGASASWTFSNILKVSPMLVEDLRKILERDEKRSVTVSEGDLTKSELDILALQRKLKRMSATDLPLSQIELDHAKRVGGKQ